MRWGLVLAATTSVACAGLGKTQTGDEPDAHPYVILVSLDAFRADYVDKYHPPAIEALASRGVRAEALIPVFPSKTFPNHYSIATGLYPGVHGIVGNVFYDPARGAVYRNNDTLTSRFGDWYGGEPVWATAQRNGVHTGAFFWPGSEAAINGVRPDFFVTYNSKTTIDARVDGVAAWLRKPAAERPHLILMYISEVDDTSHKTGPDSPATVRAIGHADAGIARLMDSVRAMPFSNRVNVVVVSDHGMEDISRARAEVVSDALLRAGLDTTALRMSDNGPVVSLYLNGDSVRIRAVQSALNRELTHVHTYMQSEAPARWHLNDNPRFGDLLVVAEQGWVVIRRSTDKVTDVGAHGYDPADPLMAATFVAAGPNIRPLGRIAAFENVNVYPFIAALLGLRSVPAVDGSIGQLQSVLR